MMSHRLVLKVHHLRKRHALRGHRDRLNDAGVLHRKEAFRHDDEQQRGQRQRGGEAEQHQRLMREDDIERAAVSPDDPIERPLGPAIEPAALVVRRVREQPRRHHRRQRQRHRPRKSESSPRA